MKFVYNDIEHIIAFSQSPVSELVIENRKLFSDVVFNVISQSNGASGKCVLSISDSPVEFSRYADVTLQFTPFEVNRKPLLTKLCAALEQNAVSPENYSDTCKLLSELEAFIQRLAYSLALDIDCKKIAIGPVLRAVSPEITDTDMSTLEKIFSYMELIRELDRDRLFIMINMRTYFSDADMELFAESACLHGFNVLLLESTAYPALKSVKRYTVDEDLCEF